MKARPAFIPASGCFAPVDSLPTEILLLPAGRHRIRPGSHASPAGPVKAAPALPAEGIAALMADPDDVAAIAAPHGEVFAYIDECAAGMLEASLRAIVAAGVVARLNIEHDAESPICCTVREIRWRPGVGVLATVAEWSDLGELLIARGGWAVSPSYTPHPPTGRPYSFLADGILGAFVRRPAFGEVMRLPQIDQ